jgi:ATP-dependent DNA ligase
MEAEELFCEMKSSTEEETTAFVHDDNMSFERKYDGTASAIVFSREKDGDELTNTVNLDIFGRGVLKTGEQQEYSETFPDLIPSTMKFILKSGIVSARLLSEIVCLDENGNESFKAIEYRCNRKKEIEKYAALYPAQFMVFDIAELNGEDLRGKPRHERRAILEDIAKHFEHADRFRLIEKLSKPEEKQELLDRVLDGKHKIEGIVAKNINTVFGDAVFKFKPVSTEDVFWEGEFVPGEKRHIGKVGSLVCYQYLIDPDTGEHIKTDVGKIGGGITDVLRNELTEMVSESLAPELRVSPTNKLVLEAQTHELLPSGKMRYPNFLRWRTDKTPEQCTRVHKIIPTKSSTKARKKPEVVVVEEPQSSIEDWF